MFSENRYIDIDIDFMGFVETYYYLSKIIPKHFIVYDFGCGYNAQSYFFTKHKKYIAIEPNIHEVFKPQNCEHFYCTTKTFITEKLTQFDKDESFAICNAVPNWYKENSIELVKRTFSNVYTFYPSHKEFNF